jgi:hypothetical protein
LYTRKPPHRLFLLITLIGLALILYLRLIPFYLVWDGQVPLERLSLGPLALRDGPLNVLLFIPFGFGLAGLLSRPATSNEVRTTWTILFISLALSAALEAIQLFMPSRAPSLADVAANGIGALVGYGLFRAWDMGFDVALQRYATRRNLLIGLALYTCGAALLTIYLNRSVRLSNWDPSFPLVVGNEAGDGRPWRGSVRYLIFDAYVESDEVFRIGYAFEGTAPFTDPTSGDAPPLDWVEGPIDVQRDDLVILGPGEWLATDGPFAEFNESVQRDDFFFISIGMASADQTQYGPARIVSISADADRRNITIGQERDALIIRLRTPASGENGQKPELLMPGVFVSSKWRNQDVTIRYNAPLMMVWVDGMEYALSLAPGVAFFSGFMTANRWQITMSGDAHRYDWAYWGIIVGLGVLIFGGLAVAGQIIKRRGID